MLRGLEDGGHRHAWPGGGRALGGVLLLLCAAAGRRAGGEGGSASGEVMLQSSQPPRARGHHPAHAEGYTTAQGSPPWSVGAPPRWPQNAAADRAAASGRGRTCGLKSPARSVGTNPDPVLRTRATAALGTGLITAGLPLTVIVFVINTPDAGEHA